MTVLTHKRKHSGNFLNILNYPSLGGNENAEDFPEFRSCIEVQ